MSNTTENTASKPKGRFQKKQELTPLISSSSSKLDSGSNQTTAGSQPISTTTFSTVSTKGGPAPATCSGGVTKLLDKVLPDSQHTYSVGVAIIFTANYTFGVGVLGLPYDFYDAGFVLSSLVLLWCGLLTYVVSKNVSNLMWRAEVITTLLLRHTKLEKKQFLDRPDVVLQHLSSSNLDNNLDVDITLEQIVSEYDKFSRNEYELNSLVGLFLGRKWHIAYDITFVVQGMTSLWAYNVLFGASLARIVGIPGISYTCDIETNSNSDCRALYSLYNCLFLVYCLLLVLMSFTQQIGLQVGTFIARLTIVAVMIFTSVGLIYGDLEYSDDSGKYTQRDDTSTPYYGKGEGAFRFGGMIYFIASAIFAFNSQNAIPDIIHPLTKEDRPKIGFIYACNLSLMAAIWLMVGISFGFFFGEQTEDPCTLAWKYFRGFEYYTDGSSARPGWSYFVSFLVLLLPPIDMLSGYPLNCISLCNSIEQTLFDMEKIMQITEAGAGGAGGAGGVGAGESKYLLKRRILVRVSVVLVCGVLGLLTWEFDVIVVIAGLFAMIALYFIPAYAEYKSQKIMEQIVDDPQVWKTPITDWTSHVGWMYATFFTVFCGVIGVIVELASGQT